MSQEKSLIELVGLGTMMSWTFIDENQWNLLQSESPEQDELLQQLIDESLNDNVFSAVLLRSKGNSSRCLGTCGC